MSPKASVVRAVRGADGDVSVTISWMASRSFSRCNGLLEKEPKSVKWPTAVSFWTDEFRT